MVDVSRPLTYFHLRLSHTQGRLEMQRSGYPPVPAAVLGQNAGSLPCPDSNVLAMSLNSANVQCWKRCAAYGCGNTVGGLQHNHALVMKNHTPRGLKLLKAQFIKTLLANEGEML